MYVNRRNVRVLKEIGAEEHDGDVRFKSGSGNVAVLCMRNASDSGLGLVTATATDLDKYSIQMPYLLFTPYHLM